MPIAALLIAPLTRDRARAPRRAHAVGDAALTTLRRILRESRRQIDYAACAGGEEFALILPETSEQEAYVVAERRNRSKIFSAEMRRHPEIGARIQARCGQR